MITALVKTLAIMYVENNYHFRINVSLLYNQFVHVLLKLCVHFFYFFSIFLFLLIFSCIQFVRVLLSRACNFSFYEKVQPFPWIMTFNIVGPMVTLLFFKVPLYFKWKCTHRNISCIFSGEN